MQWVAIARHRPALTDQGRSWQSPLYAGWQPLSPNEAIESAAVGRPTRKSEALLLAAQRERYAVQEEE